MRNNARAKISAENLTSVVPLRRFTKHNHPAECFIATKSITNIHILGRQERETHTGSLPFSSPTPRRFFQ